MNLTYRILIGMGAGLLIGSLFQMTIDPEGWVYVLFVDQLFFIGGKIFIALLQLMVVPLVFASIVCGAANLSDGTSIGRLGGKTVGLYLLTTCLAVSMALVLAISIDPGAGPTASVESEFVPPEARPIRDVIIGMVPTNPVAAMATANMLQIIVFALLLGFVIARSGQPGAKVRAFFEDFNVVMMNLITLLIRAAPVGVFCLMANLFAEIGIGQILDLAQYFFTVVLGLSIHLVVTYALLVYLLVRVNPIEFVRRMREPLLVAFTTSSSGATMPVTLRTVKEKLGVHNDVASFSIPLGATINMDGTAIMQGVATVFIAGFYGIDLSASSYLVVVLTATLASIGTAAVPSAGIIMLTMVLGQVGLPVEGIALILGVDRLLDMMRTAINVCGDGMVSAAVARSEGKLDMEIFNGAVEPVASRSTA